MTSVSLRQWWGAAASVGDVVPQCGPVWQARMSLSILEAVQACVRALSAAVVFMIFDGVRGTCTHAIWMYQRQGHGWGVHVVKRAVAASRSCADGSLLDWSAM
jgi:hypothetical protein